MLLDRWTLTLLIAIQLGRLWQSPEMLVGLLTLLAVVRAGWALEPYRLVLVRHTVSYRESFR